MSRVEELSSITESIARSFDNRMAGLEALRQRVEEERQAARDRLRAMAAARQEMSISTRAQLRSDRAERKATISDLLGSMHQARMEMGASQSEHLVTDSRRRAMDVQQLLEGVQAFMAETHRATQGEAMALREKLAAGRADQQAAVRELLVALRSDHAAMAQEQARELARHQAELQAEVSESIAGFRVARTALRANLDEFAQRWGEFATLMRSKRASPNPVEVEEQPEKGPPAPPEKAESGPSTEVESAPSSPLPVASTNDAGPMIEEVFLAVRSSPEGIKLADLENRFNVSRIEMAQALKHLMDDGRVRKEDRLYFAI